MTWCSWLTLVVDTWVLIDVEEDWLRLHLHSLTLVILHINFLCLPLTRLSPSLKDIFIGPYIHGFSLRKEIPLGQVPLLNRLMTIAIFQGNWTILVLYVPHILLAQMATNLRIIDILHQILHFRLRFVMLEATWQILWRSMRSPFHQEWMWEELLGLIRYGLLVGFLLETLKLTIWESLEPLRLLFQVAVILLMSFLLLSKLLHQR